MIEQSVQALLNPLASGGCWPLVVQDGVDPPYLTYQIVAAAPQNTVDDPVPGVRHYRFQVDAYESTYEAMKTLKNAVLGAMQGASFANICVMEVETYDSDNKRFVCTMDFNLYAA